MTLLPPRGRVTALLILLALIVRVAAILVLDQPLESDGLAYFTMAQGWVARGEWADIYGQHAFYSAGYPMLLVPFFALFGASVGVVLAVNLLLCALTVWLLVRLGERLTGTPRAGWLAAGVYALWLPAIWNATMVAKENLSTPLLLGMTLAALAIARGERPMRHAAIAGLLWGAGLLVGGSSLLLCAGVAVALLWLWYRKNAGLALKSGLLFSLAALLILSPWLYATQQMVGKAVLTTNGAFNLYLGNNPAATGKFISIADTPLGEGWNETRVALGEVRNAERLQAAAREWITAHPVEAGKLAIAKLGYFWEPNMPDAADFAASKAVASIRLVDIVQYAFILLFACAGFAGRTIARADKTVIAAMVAGFWLIHAAAYIIMRYRDPVMPLLIVMAGAALAQGWQRFDARRAHKGAGFATLSSVGSGAGSGAGRN
ncbi:ArnT family glycosyltransferase [Pseudonocardia sp. TMWB2A]|uniref:ArnT family glycosyltransferase n=1 Tax=Pseudonocardia sp. TMWB2A TaxID=687430 RepID=UPI00307CEA50